MRTFNWKNILFQNASAKNRVKIRAQISWKILYHKILKIVEDNFENFVFLFSGFHFFHTFLKYLTLGFDLGIPDIPHIPHIPEIFDLDIPDITHIPEIFDLGI